jgi:hypothetical protein
MTMKCLVSLTALLATLACSSADDKPAVRFSVTGSKSDQRGVVVRVPVHGEKFGATTLVRLQEVGGKPLLLGQVAPRRLLAPQDGLAEITFVLPRLDAGQTRTFDVLLSYPQDGTPKQFRWDPTPGDHSDLLWGSAPVLRYMHAPLDESSKQRREDTYKVFHHVFAADGQTLLTKGSGGHYTHHRGMFFGFNKITYGAGKKADVWHCTGDAFQSHDGFEQSAVGEVFGRHRVKVGWHGEGKEPFAEEQRELTAYLPIPGLLVEFASILRPRADHVRLDGDPQHSGFHFRASNEVADQFNRKKPETYFLRPDGKGAIGEERNWDPKTRVGPVDLPWDAMSFVVGGKRYTALYLDHPDNPKPARGSERVYGRVGNYFEYDLATDRPLRVNYRVWIQEGEMTVEQCQALSRGFIEPIKVEVK